MLIDTQEREGRVAILEHQGEKVEQPACLSIYPSAYDILQSQIAEDARMLALSGNPLPEILGEEVIYQSGTYCRKKRWYRGYYPELGSLCSNGYQGRETVAEIDVISPLVIFNIKPKL